MSAVPPEVTESAAAPRGPLFYSEPVALRADAHAQWKLGPRDFKFAAKVNSLPLMAGEFAAASQHFPILFAGAEGAPTAAMGLSPHNLFVEDGKWLEAVYVPAYVRRYPFIFIDTGEDNRFVLGIDAGAEIVRKGADAEGEALFANGEPTELVQQALQFCGDFTNGHEETRAFSAGLLEHDLLVDRHADVTLPDGRQLQLNGFKVVDLEKFKNLPDDVVVAWHRRGWLVLVHHHLSSLSRFNDLMRLQGKLA